MWPRKHTIDLRREVDDGLLLYGCSSWESTVDLWHEEVGQQIQ